MCDEHDRGHLSVGDTGGHSQAAWVQVQPPPFTYGLNDINSLLPLPYYEEGMITLTSS